MQHRMYLAPLRGVTDCIFRTCYERYFGRFDFMLTPFITTVKGKAATPSHLKDITGEENDRERVVPQILGNDADDITVLVNAIAAEGYAHVNINCGCPHPQVARKKRGSGLLQYPELVESMLGRVMDNVPVAVSVKVRLGYTDATELARLMPVLNKFNCTEVIIHPRTGKQGYTGRVDLERFAEAATLCKHPVVYNGDITSLAEYIDRQSRFPAINRWMAGRGVVQYPGLLHALRTGEESAPGKELLQRFHDDLFLENSKRLFGPSHLLGKMKEFWSYFSFSFLNSRRVCKEIVHCTSVQEYTTRVQELFKK